MLAFNDFARVTVNSLNPAWSGSINLTPGTIDWWTPAPTPSNLTTGANRKATGGSIITPSIAGVDPGTNQPGANFTWSDGNNPASNVGNHVSTAQTSGNGFQIVTPMAKWPDWRVLRVWLYMATPAQMAYTATTDDPEGVSDAEGIGGAPDLYGDNDAYKTQGAFVVDVRYASDKAGTNLTFTMLRNGGSMGYLILNAAAIYSGTPALYNGQCPLLSPVGSR